jgi:cytochrome o ubiquinol oxidase subunit II
LHDLDPQRAIDPAAVTLDVVSLDWKWLFVDPNEVVVQAPIDFSSPWGTAVRFRLTSASVINSFFLPQIGSRIWPAQLFYARVNVADLTGMPPQFKLIVTPEN